MMLEYSEHRRKLHNTGIGPLEMEILGILWDEGESSSRHVFEKTRETKRLGQSTILTVLRRLSERGILVRNGEAGTYIYSTAITREQMGGLLIDGVFGGKVRPVVEHLLKPPSTPQ